MVLNIVVLKVSIQKFKKNSFNLRKNVEFHGTENNLHIKNESPFLKLGLRLVNLDCVHLIYLVMKRLIKEYLLEGKNFIHFYHLLKNISIFIPV